MVESSENTKLTKLRTLMKEHGLDVYLVFHNDAHSVSRLEYNTIILLSFNVLAALSYLNGII